MTRHHIPYIANGTSLPVLLSGGYANDIAECVAVPTEGSEAATQFALFARPFVVCSFKAH